jgi:hypothetical protein
MASILAVPAERHYQKWPILGTYVWPNNFVGTSYQAEVNYLKTWIQNRTAWMDANMFGTCIASISEFDNNAINLFPNPTSSVVTISGLPNQGELHLIDLFGKKILTLPYHSHSIDLDISSLKNGIYFISEPNKGIHEKISKQ